MRYRRIDLNLIVALEALLEYRSVSRAASALNVTQSTMSGILNRLRESFNDPLLMQVGRTLQLTPLAESLVSPAHQAMLRIDALLETQPRFDPSTARHKIVIATSDYVISAFLADMLAALSVEAPGLSFELAPPVSSFDRELDEGHLDFVICPSYLCAPNHPHAMLFEDSYAVVAWQNNALIGDHLSLEQFNSLGHVVYRATTSRPWFDQWYLTQFGDARRIELQVSGFNLLPALVIGTDRIATVQTRLAERLARTLPLRLLPMPMQVPNLKEVLQWSRLRQSDPVHQWLRTRLLMSTSETAEAAGTGYAS